MKKIESGKSIVVPFRLTSDQRGQFDEAIHLSGLKPSAFFRALALSKPLVFEDSHTDIKRLSAIYEKAGDTLNKLAYQVNATFYRGVLSQSQFVHWLNKLVSVSSLLLSAIPTGSGGSSKAVSVDVTGDSALKTEMVSFRLTVSQAAPLSVIADKAQITLPIVCRELVLNQNPIFKRSAIYKKRLLFVFNKSNNNISQLVERSHALYKKKIISHQLYVKWLDLLISIESSFQIGIDHAD